MRALTLHQPWAHLVARGDKLVENRPWKPPHWLAGERFAIHAGKKWDERAAELIYRATGESFQPDRVIFGAILATATLCDCITVAESASLRADQRGWLFGPYGWILENIRRVAEPVYCRGFQGLWRVPEHLKAKVES